MLRPRKRRSANTQEMFGLDGTGFFSRRWSSCVQLSSHMSFQVTTRASEIPVRIPDRDVLPTTDQVTAT